MKDINRDANISIMFISTKDYNNKFCLLLQDSKMIDSALEDILINFNEIKNDELNIKGVTIKYVDLFNYSTDSKLMLQSFWLSLNQHRSTTKLESEKHIDLELLEPLLYYICSPYFKDRFYISSKYHPPIQYSKIFYEALKEIEKPDSKYVSLLNPYNPYCVDMEEAGIYHVLLSEEMVRKMEEIFKQITIDKTINETLADSLFIEDFLRKASVGEIQILLQLSP